MGSIVEKMEIKLCFVGVTGSKGMRIMGIT